MTPSTVVVGPGGGSGSVSVTTDSQCDWTATTNAPWLTISGGQQRTGPGSADFSALANTASTLRSGTLVVAGHTVTVAQDGVAACTYAVSPGVAAFSEVGGTGTVTVSSAAHCTWSAVSSAAWLQITSGSTGQGIGDVGFTVSRNMGIPERTAEILVMDQVVDVVQAGDVERCTYAVAPVSLDLCMPARGLMTTIVTDPACPWTARPDVPWISLPDGESGDGSATIRIQVDENYDAPRRGVVMLRWPAPTAGQNVQVDQAGCSYGVSQSVFAFASAGGNATVDVYQQSQPIVCGGPLQDACVWTAVPDVPWLSVVTPMPRTGDDRMVFAVAPNTSGAPRTGHVQIRDQQITVTQAG